jgi:hypothetical protein
MSVLLQRDERMRALMMDKEKMKHPSQMIMMMTIDGAIGSGGVRMKRRRGEREAAEMWRRSIIVIPSRK